MVSRQRVPQPQPRHDAGGAAPAAGGPPRPGRGPLRQSRAASAGLAPANPLVSCAPSAELATGRFLTQIPIIRPPPAPRSLRPRRRRRADPAGLTAPAAPGPRPGAPSNGRAPALPPGGRRPARRGPSSAFLRRGPALRPAPASPPSGSVCRERDGGGPAVPGSRGSLFRTQRGNKGGGRGEQCPRERPEPR